MNVPGKEANNPYPRGVILGQRSFFLSSLSSLREKFICAPQIILSAPPNTFLCSPSRTTPAAGLLLPYQNLLNDVKRFWCSWWVFKSKQVEVHYSFLEPVNLELRLAVFNFFFFFDDFQLHWGFDNASRQKSLMSFFRKKITNSATQEKNAITLKQLKIETWILEFRWGTYKPFFMQNLKAIDHVKRVSESKTEMPIGGLNSSSSKANPTSGIKVSNLEASGQAVSAPKNKLWRFPHFVFLCLFIKQISLWSQKLRYHQVKIDPSQ